MKTVLAILAPLPLLAACASAGPSVVSSSPQGVMVKFKEGQVDAATQKANDICRTQKRDAKLHNITPQGKETRIGNFDCL